MTTFDDRICTLGEGPLWHPERAQLFWFDILGNRLLSRTADGPMEWQFDENVSAAGWVDRDRLLIASETCLSVFDLASGARDKLVDLEADNPVTRSNDGRADPFGGFWIGTMGKNAEDKAGAIYRYYRGEVVRLYSDVTIPNAICFAPDGRTAYYTDTTQHVVMRQMLDGAGWPEHAPTPFLDLNAEGLNPDGAVIDTQGNFWGAQWGASRVAQYDTKGNFLTAVNFPASQISCPAFGGADMKTLFATSAATGVSEADGGKTFTAPVAAQGQKEHRVIL